MCLLDTQSVLLVRRCDSDPNGVSTREERRALAGSVDDAHTHTLD
jgi:hypothetical protein